MSTILDISNSEEQINNRISAFKTAGDVFKSEKTLKSSAGNSFTKSQQLLTSQLNQIKDLQKRYQREPPNSLSQLTNFISQTRGQGPETLNYLRKKLLEVSAAIEPKVSAIIKEESLKALGCSQSQTYQGFSIDSLQLNPLSTIPQGPNDGTVYIPVQSVDLFSNLKNGPESKVGKVYYEKQNPSGDPTYKPFGGRVNFPMNKQLNQLMDSSNIGRSMNQLLGTSYRGKSGQNLFDIQYTTTNGFGVSGNFFRVALVNRNNNKVGEFISDYYSTIRIIDSVNIGAQIVNLLSGAINISAQVGFGELNNQSRFYLIAQRILGLCFDNRREIDVSGNAKVGELDGVDESFYEFNEIDLRNIDSEITNVQNGVMEFVDCDNIKLPVDSENIVSQLIEFRDKEPDTVEEQVQQIETIINSLSENPEWKVISPNSFNFNTSINNNVLKKLPLAVAASVLTPKVLLPIFVLMATTQSAATYTYNSSVTDVNTGIGSTNTISQQSSNIVTDGVDFLKKWKTFSIGLISRINAEFLKTLFEILKKDILLLLNTIIRDISRTQALKKYAIILRLLEIAIVIARIINDYRRCKSLLSNILYLLNLINGVSRGGDIPLPLLAAAKFLPGFSPQRATINVIEEMQQLGLPTGTLPDGSPNLMLLYNLAATRGFDNERRNEKITVINTGIVGYGVPQ